MLPPHATIVPHQASTATESVFHAHEPKLGPRREGWLPFLVMCGVAAACERAPHDEPRRGEPQHAPAAPPPTALERTRPTSVPATLAPACPVDMVLVEGEFCPDAEQVCERWDPTSAPGAERCTRFRAPSVCLSKTRILMRFCVDTYEWPNRAAAKPRLLTSWTEAKALCEAVGKRLCEESEWLFACEGPEMLPYTYGFMRDPTACVVDRFYETPSGRYRRWDECRGDPECDSELRRIDQSEPAGSFARCLSPFGAFDMNGNANEWVEVEGTYPHRSGLKGGWWGPVRSRCRPTVRFHKEDDWGYEVGFRCCKNAEP